MPLKGEKPNSLLLPHPRFLGQRISLIYCIDALEDRHAVTELASTSQQAEALTWPCDDGVCPKDDGALLADRTGAFAGVARGPASAEGHGPLCTFRTRGHSQHLSLTRCPPSRNKLQMRWDDRMRVLVSAPKPSLAAGQVRFHGCITPFPSMYICF